MFLFVILFCLVYWMNIVKWWEKILFIDFVFWKFLDKVYLLYIFVKLIKLFVWYNENW